MSAKLRRRAQFVCLVVVACLLASLPGVSTAQARKDDSEPGVSDTFGRSNKAVSSRDINVRAVNAALLKKYDEAQRLARQSGNRLTRKIVEWIYLRKKPRLAGYTRLMNFVHANPVWPKVGLLKTYAERQLLWDNAPVHVLEQHFLRDGPRSPAGYAAKARLELARGNKKAARKLVQKALFNPNAGAKTLAAIRASLGSVLTRADYERRLWILVHAQKTNAAIATARFVSRAHIKAAQAAKALIRRRKNAIRLYRKLPSSLRGKLAIQYALARYYRKKGKLASALSILRSVSARTSGTYDQAAWWVERRLIIREMAGRANARYWPALYKQATRHGFSRGKDFEEGEFLSGWLALRKLGNAKQALVHFKRMTHGAKSRTQQSRGAYWVARAYLKLGDRAKADKYLKRAAANPTVFYGLLAREALGKGRAPIRITAVTHTAADLAQVKKYELLRAVRLLRRAGGEREIGSFLWPVARIVKTRRQASAVADFLHSQGGAHLALRFAKASGAMGRDIDNWGYPLRAMPTIRRIGRPVEKSVVFALSRQESEFNAKARSYVGARGLMQLMPSTAKRVARKYRLRHSTGKLTSRPAYNAMLGTALLGDLINQFNGSYILTFVGYNAGPGRSLQWVRKYGDPRSGKTDPIDWIESVPFTETRKYIQKVLQNVHIYRSRLNPRAMVGMSRDLRRGKPGSTTRPTRANAKSSCGGRKSLVGLIQDC